jgi:small subunit ribosomal protein S11
MSKKQAGHKNQGQAKKKQVKLSVDLAHIHIRATYNNFKVSAALPNGDVFAWTSGGRFASNSRKNSPSLAEEAGQTLGRQIKSMGIVKIKIFLNGIHNTRDAVIRGLHVSGLEIQMIYECTGIPHNGCRRRKKRRM